MKKKTVILIILAGIAIASVGILYVAQLDKKKNGFYRSFLPETPVMQSVQDIRFDSYYIGGFDDESIFLGNNTAPLHVLVVGRKHQDTRQFVVKLDSQYQKVLQTPQLSITGNKISLIDGARGQYYVGNLEERNVTRYQNKIQGFDASVVIDSIRLIFRALDTLSGNYYVGAFNYLTNDLVVKKDLFNNYNNALFANDGQLVYDGVSKMAVYVFYYQHKIICMNGSVDRVHTWQTIDTISSPKIIVENNKIDKSYKVNGSSVMVNKYVAADRGLLYVNSLLKADNEPVLQFNQSSVIDVYSMSDGRYLSSFYLPRYRGNKIKDFRVVGNKLVAIYSRYLVTYVLDDIKM